MIFKLFRRKQRCENAIGSVFATALLVILNMKLSGEYCKLFANYLHLHLAPYEQALALLPAMDKRFWSSISGSGIHTVRPKHTNNDFIIFNQWCCSGLNQDMRIDAWSSSLQVRNDIGEINTQTSKHVIIFYCCWNEKLSLGSRQKYFQIYFFYFSPESWLGPLSCLDSIISNHSHDNNSSHGEVVNILLLSITQIFFSVITEIFSR